MTLPELLPSVVNVAGAIVVGVLVAAGLMGTRARPQPVPVPVRRDPRRRR
ncbi:hypothetical protein SAMN05444354_103417 [Stigmatella aurantiaca]|uniref:Uncharacterized protein n=1 Tax=Stigmatella aurantiaca TaxID=41 RepID=A0A1H7M3I4_STIAU|nr:hypothetical protein [Stigmatella aurantiaca]SEL05672.1 hypothetical protein SAMN05444354_103417 [Stigmatella aurantiaca]